MTGKARTLLALFGCFLLTTCATADHRQAQGLLSKYGWTTTGRQATYRITQPQRFEHRPGEFPIPIYWAYIMS